MAHFTCRLQTDSLDRLIRFSHLGRSAVVSLIDLLLLGLGPNAFGPETERSVEQHVKTLKAEELDKMEVRFACTCYSPRHSVIWGVFGWRDAVGFILFVR